MTQRASLTTKPSLREESIFGGAANPITTGQGNGEAYGNWMARGLSSQLAAGRMGNKRGGPTPTCGIPLLHVSLPMVPLEPQKSGAKDMLSSAKVADTMLGESCGEEPGTAGGSSDVVPTQARSATGSLESSQAVVNHPMVKQEAPVPEYEASEPNNSEASDEDDEGGMDYIPEESARNPGRSSSRPAPKRVRKGKEKKKVGRPIAYRGDPNAPELTDAERRRIKRRIANRESARRVRHKRQEELEEMQLKMEHILSQNEQLRQHAEQIGEQKKGLMTDLQLLQQQYGAMSNNNKLLGAEIQSLRQSLQLKMSALEEELDKRADEAEGAGLQSGFGSSEAQAGVDFPASSQPYPQPVLSMEKQQSALDWFPSLNLDDPRAMEMLNCLLDDAPSNPMATPDAHPPTAAN